MSSRQTTARTSTAPTPTDAPTLAHGSYTTADLRDLLKRFGYCVVSNVLDRDALAQTRRELADAYASLYESTAPDTTPAGLNINDPATLNSGATPPYRGNGVVAVEQVGGLRALERLRLNERVAEPFRIYYDCASSDQLAKGYDRFGVMLPNTARSGLDPHIDACISDNDGVQREDIIQGVLIIQAAARADQGFVVYPGFHDDVSVWTSPDDSPRTGDWFVIPDNMRSRLGRGLVVSPPAGSMILFKSSTVHGNTSGAGRKTEVGRICAYIAMYPWSRMSAEAIGTLTNAMLSRTTLNHNLLRPTAQRKATPRFGPPNNWRFHPSHLTNYTSAAELPPALLPPATNE